MDKKKKSLKKKNSQRSHSGNNVTFPYIEIKMQIYF